MQTLPHNTDIARIESAWGMERPWHSWPSCWQACWSSSALHAGCCAP